MAIADRISILVDFVTDGAERGLSRIRTRVGEAEGAFGKMKAGAAGAMSLIQDNALLVGAAVTGMAVKAVNDASNLEESINAVRVTFGEAADEVLRIGENSAQSFGLSTAEFNSAAVQFSSFAKTIAGEGGDVAGVIEELTQRAADFASVQNLEVNESTRIFMSTLAGETEPIRRYGKDISAAAVELYALESGLIRNKSEMTESIKVQARYELLMEQTADSANDFANTSDGLANSQRILKAEFTNASAAAGQILLPALQEVAGGLRDVVEAGKGLDAALPGGFATWFGAVADASPVKLLNDYNKAVIGFVSGIFDAGEASTELHGATVLVSDAIEDLDAVTRRAAYQIGGAAASARDYTSVQDEVTDSVNAAIDAQERQNRALEDARNRQRELADAHYAAQVAGEDLIETIGKSTETLEDQESTALDNQAALREVALAADEYAAAQVVASGVTLDSVRGQQVWNDEMLNVAATLGGPMAQEIAEHVGRVNDIPEEKATWIAALLDQGKTAEALALLDEEIEKAEGRATTGGQEIGGNIAAGVASGITAGSVTVRTTAQTMVEDAIRAAKAAAGIESPSKLFRDEVGAPIAEGVAQGIVETSDKISESLTDAIEDARVDAVKAAEDLVDAVQDTLSGMWGEIDAQRRYEDMQESVADAEMGVLEATQAAALAAVEYGEGSVEHRRALERVTQANERLEDANYRLLRASEELLLSGEMSEEQYVALAEAAGLERGEIDKLIESYRELAEARREAATAEAEITAEAERAQSIVEKFQQWAATGRWSQAVLDNIAKMDPREQLEWMTQMVRDAERDLAAWQSGMGNSRTDRPNKPRHTGGRVAPGDMVQPLSGELFVPDQYGEVMSREDARRAMSPMTTGASSDGARIVNVTVQAGAVVANKAELGRFLIEAIEAAERRNGSGWRRS